MTVVELLFLVSMTVGKSSNRILHSICGSLSIESSLMVEGQLSTHLKCSAYLSKTTSLSVKRVILSALSNVVPPEFSGP